jgi:hypothetical protein
MRREGLGQYRQTAGVGRAGDRPKNGASFHSKDNHKGHGRPLWRSRRGSLRQPSRPISPNVLDLGNEFMGMREAFLNLAQ